MRRIITFLACQLLCVVLAHAQNEETVVTDSVQIVPEASVYKGLDESFAEAFPKLSKKDKPAYKKTSYWKWKRFFKATGITLMSLGLTYTIVYGVFDAADGAIHEFERPIFPDENTSQKENDKTPDILYLPGAAAFGLGAVCYGLSFVFKHKAKKSVELNSSLLPALRKDGSMGTVPALTLSYSF